MSNISTDFIKINDEYVKFYATTNTALPEILKNTGALIVVQDNDKVDELDDHIRSLYIARNFVAEGHGFSANTVRDYYDNLGKYHVDNLGYITTQRELSYILSGLQHGIDMNAETIQLYVLTDGGVINETYIDAFVPNSDSTERLRSKYIINLLKPAEYKDTVITKAFSYITYQYSNSFDGDNVFTSYATNIKNLDFNNRYTSRELIYDIPRGAKINSTYFYMESENNDTAGFTATSEENNSYEIPAAVSSVFVIDENVINTNFNENQDVIYNDEHVDFIADNIKFTAHNRGSEGVTPKKYPWLPDNINYYSYENFIDGYDVELASVKCNIYDVIKYNFCESNSQINTTTINNLSSRIYNNTSNDTAYTLISCTEVSGNNKYLTISVPENYEITHISQIKKYERANNSLSYYEYNITGDAYEIERNDSDMLSYHYRTYNKFYCGCRNYYIKNPLDDTDVINISLRKNFAFNNEFINDLIVDDTMNIDVSQYNDKYNVTSYFLQNSEYNSNHWMSPMELSYIQNVI